MRTRIAKTYENLLIEGMSTEGMGIAKPEGKVVFVEGAVPGDLCNVRVKKSHKSYEEAIISEIVKPSTYRVEPVCKHFGTCGGCKWQHIAYNAQVQYKETIVSDAFERLAKCKPEKRVPAAAADAIHYYRNKLEYTFSNKRWLTVDEIQHGDENLQRNALGFHIPGLFDKIVDVDHCFLQGGESNAIRNFIRKFAIENAYSFYDIREQKGFLRTLIIKTNTQGQTLLCIAYGENNSEQITRLNNALLENFSSIVSLYYTVNTKKNDTIFDLDVSLFSGEAHLVEHIGSTAYKIGPKSFFQTNPIQGKTLYDITLSMANPKQSDTIYDLYTGVGSIALYVASKCKQVVGIEEIAPAIDDAKANAALNDIHNCFFYTGDVKKIIGSSLYEKHGTPDIIITDPPRAGMHEDVVKELLRIEAPKIVYVSCNPSTQARDISLLSEKYTLAISQAVDMFPHTKHIENIVLLTLTK